MTATATVTVLVRHGDGTLTRWTGRYLDAAFDDDRGLLAVHGEAWHRTTLTDPQPAAEPASDCEPDGDDRG